MENKTFYKMHGAGNDMILVEPQFFGMQNQRNINGQTFSEAQMNIISKQVIKICHRNFGIGADGIVIVSKGLLQEKYKITYLSSDGSFWTWCGNGTRCVAAYLAKEKKLGKKFIVGTDAGNKQIQIIKQNNGSGEWLVQVDMGRFTGVIKQNISEFDFSDPLLYSCIENATIISSNTGDQHTAVHVTEEQLKQIEKENLFLKISNQFRLKNLAIINFTWIKSPQKIKVITCEKGAGVTLACGTGVSSTVYSGFCHNILSNKVEVETRGGLITVEIVKGVTEEDTKILMTGPAVFVFKGTLN